MLVIFWEFRDFLSQLTPIDFYTEVNTLSHNDITSFEMRIERQTKELFLK